MTRVSIHGGQVDVLCGCGQPRMYSELLQYGFRLMFDCSDCQVSFAIDVIE
jgi:hypothetical protein